MPEPRRRADVRIALWAAVLLTGIGIAVESEAFAFVLVPVVFLLVAYVMFRVPLRHSLIAMMFLAFALPNPIDYTPSDDWQPPLLSLGSILLYHLNAIDRNIGALSWCSFSGMDVLIATLFVVVLVRRATGSSIDRRGRVPTPKPLVQLAYVSLAAPVYVWLLGMVRGGDARMSLWQIDQVMHLPLLFLLFHLGLRGPKDHIALARVLLGAAAYKAILAIYIIRNVPPRKGEWYLGYATSHADSMLFACAMVFILALLIERAGRRARWLAVFFIPLLTWGISSNNRRIAWVQVAFVFLAVFFATRDSPFKRKIRRTLLMASPLVALYFYVGWESTLGIFKPARIMRSVTDTETDPSSFWRELENFDLIATVRSHPVFGTGYGHGYEEVVVLPHVTYSLERFVPHNSILGLWSFCGIIGYTALTLLWTAGVYFAIRSYRVSTDPGHRAAALVSFGAVLIYLLQCWGDLGLGTWTGVFMVAPALVVGGKLANVTGAWGTKKPKPTRTNRLTPIPGGAEQAA